MCEQGLSSVRGSPRPTMMRPAGVVAVVRDIKDLFARDALFEPRDHRPGLLVRLSLGAFVGFALLPGSDAQEKAFCGFLVALRGAFAHGLKHRPQNCDVDLVDSFQQRSIGLSSFHDVNVSDLRTAFCRLSMLSTRLV